MVYSRILPLLMLFVIFVVSCKTDDKKEADADAVQMDLSSEDLDQELFACKSVKDVQSFLNRHPHLSSIYFTDSPVDSAQLPAYLFNILQNQDLQAFEKQLDSLIGNRDTTILIPLQKAFKNIKHHYPDFKAPRIEFMVTGFTGNDLYISDSLIIIGLDYFGGPSARFRPDVFDYHLKRYQKEYIVPAIVFFTSNRYNKMDASDQTLLADMVAYGKGYEFVKQVMPDTPDSLILGYSGENLRRTYNSQLQIWSYFISAKLLYEKSDLRKKKFIEERPFTSEIGEKVPGAVGRWLGWRVVGHFMTENPKVTLVELMQMDNAARILQESGYKGEPDDQE
jgi:hypothetical protein